MPANEKRRSANEKQNGKCKERTFFQGESTTIAV